MKKLLLMVVLAGVALAGFAQKPVITITMTSDDFFQTITITASQPVPEKVVCGGQYQAPNYMTGNWLIELPQGWSDYTLSVPGMVPGHGIAFDYVSLGASGTQYFFEFILPPFETNNAIYYFIGYH